MSCWLGLEWRETPRARGIMWEVSWAALSIHCAWMVWEAQELGTLASDGKDVLGTVRRIRIGRWAKDNYFEEEWEVGGTRQSTSWNYGSLSCVESYNKAVIGNYTKSATFLAAGLCVPAWVRGGRVGTKTQPPLPFFLVVTQESNCCKSPSLLKHNISRTEQMVPWADLAFGT